MKVVVIGATGNVGTSLLGSLAQDPDITEVVGLARRLPHGSWAKTRLVAADITSADLHAQVRGADAVVHLAWLFQPTHRPTVTWGVNVGGTRRIVDAVVAERVPVLVCASSVGAYSPGRGREVDETWPTDGMPTSAYGREKAYVERLLDTAEAANPWLRVVRMRPAFIFKKTSGTQQRRLFLGPLLPKGLLEPGRLPVLPFPSGLYFQALHSDDAAEAYRLALKKDVRGAFNLAAEPVVRRPDLARLLGTRLVPLPAAFVRADLWAAWHLHLVPAEPALFDLALNRPILLTRRARDELGWSPRVSAVDALGEALAGMRLGSGGPTPALAADSGRSRARELASGVGEVP